MKPSKIYGKNKELTTNLARKEHAMISKFSKGLSTLPTGAWGSDDSTKLSRIRIVQ